MKQFKDDIWIDEREDGTINIGFRQDFIDRKLMECFHIVQADSKQVQENGPMFVIETNNSLESVKAPCTGRIIAFNSKARNFPDKLNENDVIMTLSIKPEELKAAKPKVVYEDFLDQILDEPQIVGNWFVAPGDNR